jgi:hypothetical protein
LCPQVMPNLCHNLSVDLNEGEYLGFTESLWPDQGEGPWAVRVWWADIAGRAEPVGFGFWKRCYLKDNVIQPLNDSGPEPIQSADLRHIPFAQIVAQLREISAERWDRDSELAKSMVILQMEPGEPAPEHAPEAEQLRKFVATIEGTARPFERKPRERHPPAFWKRVAEIYADAWQHGRNPTKAVQRELHLSSPSTAAKYVARARFEGELGPITQGRAGGILPPKTGRRGRPPKTPAFEGSTE